MTRRPNGAGSVYQRKDGRWAASVSLGNGRRQHFLGRSWDDAHQKLVTAQKAIQDGLPPAPAKQTVRQFLTPWLETSAPSRKPRTNKRYRELVELHVLPQIGRIQLTKLTPMDVQAVYTDMLKKGLSPTTVQQVHAILHKAFKTAVGWNLMYRNPTDYAERPRVEYREVHVLNAEQVRAFLDAAKGTRYEALFVLAVTTGMRQGELLGLRWQDLDLDASLIHVRHAMQRIDGEWRFVEPKSAKSRRQIGLGPMAIEALRYHRGKQVEDRFAVGGVWQDMSLVFCNELGRPVEVSNLTNRYFQPLLKKAGLPIVRFHDLRHTAATLMLNARIDAKVVSAVLGHSQVAFTMDRYMHVDLRMQSELGRSLDSMLMDRPMWIYGDIEPGWAQDHQLTTDCSPSQGLLPLQQNPR